MLYQYETQRYFKTSGRPARRSIVVIIISMVISAVVYFGVGASPAKAGTERKKSQAESKLSRLTVALIDNANSELRGHTQGTPETHVALYSNTIPPKANRQNRSQPRSSK